MIINLTNKIKLIISLEKQDPLFDEAIKAISKYNQVGVSHLQKELKIGYARADLLLTQLCSAGLISLPPTGLRRVFADNVKNYINNPKEYKRKQKEDYDDFLNRQQKH